jgi:hypothetical protein
MKRWRNCSIPVSLCAVKFWDDDVIDGIFLKLFANPPGKVRVSA